MPRRPSAAGAESAAAFARKMEILQREMAAQQAAIERLKQLSNHGQSRRERDADAPPRDTSA